MPDDPRRYRGRILRPIPYEHERGRSVAPIGAYDIAEVGEHFHFFSEDGDPFQIPRHHALMHRQQGHLEIEDWES
jgi:hypothetical protein